MEEEADLELQEEFEGAPVHVFEDEVDAPLFVEGVEQLHDVGHLAALPVRFELHGQLVPLSLPRDADLFQREQPVGGRVLRDGHGAPLAAPQLPPQLEVRESKPQLPLMPDRDQARVPD